MDALNCRLRSSRSSDVSVGADAGAWDIPGAIGCCWP